MTKKMWELLIKKIDNDTIFNSKIKNVKKKNCWNIKQQLLYIIECNIENFEMALKHIKKKKQKG